MIAPQALLENVFEKARRRRLFRLRTREDWAEVQGLGSPKIAATFRALLSRVQGGEGHLGR